MATPMATPIFPTFCYAADFVKFCLTPYVCLYKAIEPKSPENVSFK